MLRRALRTSLSLLVTVAAGALAACDRSSAPAQLADLPDEPSPHFRNVAAPTAYVGDSACASCHRTEAAVYAKHAMARSFHPWTSATRNEAPTTTPIASPASGYTYAVTEADGHLYQVERLGAQGGSTHELRRRMDYVMGSGAVGQTYFTEQNGRLFQLPLTWYRERGWDFSPGYQANNGRFDRLMPNRCISCHSSYPKPLPNLEGKYAELHPGIGCERCHGPGALHVAERSAHAKPDSGYDRSIVNPSRLPVARRMDVCEQCHVHTSVAVLREGKDEFSFVPSQALRDQYAFFRVSGSIDIVSHADRLRQSKCFIATRATQRPLECATCHNPHQPPLEAATRSKPCLACHQPATLAKRFAGSPSLATHAPTSDCVSCHMPREQERAVHGAFTEHWIRIVTPGSGRPSPAKYAGAPIEPYFDRDRTGPDAKIYQGMGEIVYATLSNDRNVLTDGIAALDSALAGSAAHPKASFLLGVADAQLGMHEEAIRALDASARADSAPETLRALAQAWLHAGRPATAVAALYERALARQPALAWMRAEYADLLAANGRDAEAKAAYRGALAEEPDRAVTWFNLGALLTADGDLGASRIAFRKAVELDPTLGEALSPLLEVDTKEAEVTDVKSLGSPMSAVTVRDPRQVQVVVAAGRTSLSFLGVPAHGEVDILSADGSVVRVMPTGAGGELSWDLRSDAGTAVGGGLYRVRVRGAGPSGARASSVFYVGLVRRRL